MFRFKQFTVQDDRCAMKVGTDGVLLGAWAMTEDCSRVLDVGTGCGLIAIMMAQRFPQASITAIEIDASAATQAAENIAASPFSDRIKVVNADFTDYDVSTYDAIVSNPPFFEEELLPPDTSRAKARHTETGMNFEILVSRSHMLLAAGGSLQVIIPKVSQTRFHALCNSQGFRLVRATDVRTVAHKSPKRVLLHFVKDVESMADSFNASAVEVKRDEIVLMADGQRTEGYARLCSEFYL